MPCLFVEKQILSFSTYLCQQAKEPQFYYIPLQQQMMNIKIKGVNNSNDRVRTDKQVEYEWGKRAIWIGRGDEIDEKADEENYSLNLQQFSKAISRIHAVIIFSPSFFTHYTQNYPDYFNRFSYKWQLNHHLFQLIWQFAKPPKKILLKDLQSKTGVFQKLDSLAITAGMHIVLGDSRPIIFENLQIYDKPYLLSLRLDQLKEKGYNILNPLAYSQKITTSFWIVTYRSNHFILFNSPSSIITIGRSPDCHLIIPQPTISRKHAYLQYRNGHWNLVDGDGKNPSSNGVWQKKRKLYLQYGSKEKKSIIGQNYVKVGNVLLHFHISEEREQCMSVNRSTNGSVQERGVKQADQLEYIPMMTKGRSHY